MRGVLTCMMFPFNNLVILAMDHQRNYETIKKSSFLKVHFKMYVHVTLVKDSYQFDLSDICMNF